MHEFNFYASEGCGVLIFEVLIERIGWKEVRMMDLQRYFNRKCFTGMLLTTFMAVCYLYHLADYTERHNITIRKIGSFNQGALQDISAIFERETTNLTNTVSVLRALRKDGFSPQLLSSFFENRTKTHTDEISTTVRRNHINHSGVKETMNALVPKIVHYVFMGNRLTFTFVNYLSFLSVERFLKPEQIFVHGDEPPVGHWWNVTMQQVKNIYHVKRPYMDTAPNGKPLKYPAHAADYIRLDVLLQYGGIYLDADVLILKSFDPLLNYATVIGRETSYGLCNGIIIAKKGAPFLRLMLEQYRSYKGLEEQWAEKSVENTQRLMELYPHLIHVEEASLNRPNWDEKVQIYHYNYDWSGNYAMHLWIRAWPPALRPSGLEDVLTLDSTFGEMARSILFGLDKWHKNVSITTSRPIIIGLLLQL